MSFSGVRSALHTPFCDAPDQLVPIEPLRVLGERMLDLGVSGLVVLGLTSEAWALTERERDVVCESVAVSFGGRVPIVVGIEGTSAVAVDRARRAVRSGATGLMVLPPRGSATIEQLVSHFCRWLRPPACPS